MSTAYSLPMLYGSVGEHQGNKQLLKIMTRISNSLEGKEKFIISNTVTPFACELITLPVQVSNIFPSPLMVTLVTDI